MAKVAILASFEPITRLVIELPKEGMSEKEIENFIDEHAEKISDIAYAKITPKIDEYLSCDNFGWEMDKEMLASEDESACKID